MADRFRERGYTQEVVDQAIAKVNTERQRRATTKEKKVFVTKYTMARRYIKHIVRTHWHHLQTDAILGPVCHDTPMFAYKRAKKLLKVVLVKANNKAHYSTQHFLANPQPDTTPLVTHCKEYNHNISSLRLMGIDQIISSGGGIDKNTLLLRREVECIFRLDTVTPMGLNDALILSCFLQTR
ncbi:hypothetical protein XELAEV_18015677mg [Xenopus laevis]|uniref:Uncharacterized protein n=1 Tax=Xenopus laevis TaxID=8355 RepID=A0A974DJP3_XENLA|nr:hypothetical protein XELAEV_18015677mg [Xenopus laevis]